MRFPPVTGCIFSALIGVATASTVCAQAFTKIHTAQFQFLRIPTTARSVALGGNGVADATDPDNQHYNPAVLSMTRGFGVTYNLLDWIADVDFAEGSIYGGRAFGWGQGSSVYAAGSIRYKTMTIDAPANRTVFLPGGTGRELDDEQSFIGAAAAAALAAGPVEVGAGLAIRRMDGDILSESVDGWAYDIGVLVLSEWLAAPGIALTPSLGASLLNVGPDVRVRDVDAPLPSQWRVGTAVRMAAGAVELLGRTPTMGSVVAVVDYANDDHPDREKLGLGFEMGLVDALFLRWGQSRPIDRSAEQTRAYGVGFGWQIQRFGLRVNYTEAESAAFFPDVDGFGVRLTYEMDD